MKKYLLIFLLSVQPFVGTAQTIQSNNLLKTSQDSLIHASVLYFLNNSSRVGLSAGIYHPNNLSIYHYGSIQKDKQILPTDKTVYEIGSIQKLLQGHCLHKL